MSLCIIAVVMAITVTLASASLPSAYPVLEPIASRTPLLRHVEHEISKSLVETETASESSSGVTMGAWIKMMCQRPNAQGVCPGNANTVAQISTCQAAGVPTQFGLYEWGTSAAGVTAATDGATPGSTSYFGRIRSGTGLRGRCEDYNTGAWATVGSHKKANFQTALNSCNCIWYRYETHPAVPTEVIQVQLSVRRSQTITRNINNPNTNQPFTDLAQYIDYLEAQGVAACRLAGGCGWNVLL